MDQVSQTAYVKQFEQGTEAIRDYARSNPYWFGTIVSAGVSLFVGGFAYWYLKARPHPSTMAVDLPFHHFFGHVPEMKAATEKNEWMVFQSELLNREEIKKAGIATFCLPNILFPYLHFVTSPVLIKYLWTDLDLPKSDRRNDCFRELLDHTIFVSSNEEWKWHRRILGRMFSVHNLRDYMFECSTNAAIRTVDKIRSLMMMNHQSDDNSDENKNTVMLDLSELLGRFTTDAFMEICFGKHTHSIELFPEPCEFGLAFDRIIEYSAMRFKDPLFQIKRFFQVDYEAQMTKDFDFLHRFMEDLLQMDDRRKKILDESGVNKHDVISLYLTDNPHLSQELLRNVAMGMVVAGRDTTRNLLAWCLALLCTSEQKWLQKVRDEINEIDTQELRYEDAKQRMPLTESVLLETLRLYPAASVSTRSVPQDLTLPNGLKLLKGDVVAVNHFVQGRNTELYGQDAGQFNPERWTDKGLKSYPPEVFGVFHQYPRMCLGREFALNEAKAFLFYFLKSFDYRSVGDAFPKLPNSTLLLMKGGWQVQINAIKQHN